MNHRLLIGAACAAIAFSSTAYAQDCEECAPPCEECTPSPPPSLPNAPDLTTHRGANFFANTSNGVVQGGGTPGSNGDGIYTFGGGPAAPFGDGTYTFGDSGSNVTIIANVAGAATTASTHQSSVGRSNASSALYYGIKLTANNSTTADAIAAILAHNPLASVSGSYTLSASGTGIANASGFSYFGPSGNAANAYGFYGQCGETINNSVCGTNSWSMLLGFQRGTAFSDGDANSFYAQLYFGGDVRAGCGCNTVAYPGDASAYVDPNIQLSSQLQQFGNNISLSGNNGLGNGGFVTLAGNVPEPASWALMLGGFGMLGGTMRRRRTLAVA